jgi:hypothetical protein
VLNSWSLHPFWCILNCVVHPMNLNFNGIVIIWTILLCNHHVVSNFSIISWNIVWFDVYFVNINKNAPSMYHHISNIINTLFKWAFKTIPIKKSNNSRVGADLYAKHIKKHSETSQWSCSMVELMEYSW